MHRKIGHVRRQFVAMGQQPQAQAGDPAFTALDEVVQGVVVELGAAGRDQLRGFLDGQAQVLFGELQQLPRQAQAREVPVRPLAAGDQHDQAGGLVIEEELQAAVEHRALGQVVVVQYQQQWAVDGQAADQFIEQVIEPGFESERLVALAHFQQRQGFFTEGGEMQAQAFEQAFEESAGVTVPATEPQPQTAPLAFQGLTEFDGQRALAESGRRGHQYQPPLQPGGHALTKLRAGDVAMRQRRPEEAAAGCAGGNIGQTWQSREVGHRPGSCSSSYRYVNEGHTAVRA